ncbi:MAG TPA: 3-dehydroquinate synthase [Stellaceae bacterium]|nr:3-dehydroquinate synthase [Stellaceae bacterium]
MTMPETTHRTAAGRIERVRVELGERGYDILVGPGLIGRAGPEILPLLRRKQAVIVTDETVARHHLAPLRASLAEHGIAERAVVLPPGEGTKDLAHFGRLVDDILGGGVERGTMLVALGGGVVGDIAGFAAATLLRGIDFVQIPTTLLAQVDSSVGGKTAINTSAGKNLLGAFYQPRLVLADTSSLATLPRREVRAGYGEIVKYGLIRDLEFFQSLEAEGGAICDLEPAALTRAVMVSCRMKAAIVAADEREEGDRALLNFGHTFGHALEAETGFGDRLLHGEAVALGMVLAFDFAVCLGLASGQDAYRVRRHIADAGLPTELSAIGLSGSAADRLMAHMGKDKKVKDGAITLILPRRIGEVFVMRDAPIGELRSFLAETG